MTATDAPSRSAADQVLWEAGLGAAPRRDCGPSGDGARRFRPMWVMPARPRGGTL